MRFYLFRQGKGFLSFKNTDNYTGAVSHHLDHNYATQFTDLTQLKAIRDDNLEFGPLSIVRA